MTAKPNPKKARRSSTASFAQPAALAYDSTALALTPDDMERQYKIPKSTQAKGRMSGDFCPYIKRGRNVYYLKSDVDIWLASLRRRHTSDPGAQGAA